MADETVLVVEDDPLLSELTSQILSGESFTVIEAATPGTVAAALKSCQPQWLIVDFNLDGWDGLSAIQAVRASRGVSVKVIALSGWPWTDERLMDFTKAADYCLQKPVDWDELLRLMRDGASPPVKAI